MSQNKNFFEIGVYWEQDEWGGVDSYLKNLINSEIFSSSKFTIFTNKYNMLRVYAWIVIIVLIS